MLPGNVLIKRVYATRKYPLLSLFFKNKNIQSVISLSRLTATEQIENWWAS